MYKSSGNYQDVIAAAVKAIIHTAEYEGGTFNPRSGVPIIVDGGYVVGGIVDSVVVPFLYELEKNRNYLKLPKYVVEAIGFHHPGYGQPIEEREDAKFTARFPEGFLDGSYDNSTLDQL